MSVADLAINTAFRTYDPEAMSWRGEWGIIGLYQFGDIVTYNGGTYVCNEPSGISVLAPGTTPAWEPISGGSSANNFDVSGTLTVGGDVSAGQTIIGLFTNSPPSDPYILTSAGTNGSGIAFHELFSAQNGGHRFRRELDSAGNCLMYHQSLGPITRQIMSWDEAGTQMVFAFQNPVSGVGLTVNPRGITTPAIETTNGQNQTIPVSATTTIFQLFPGSITPGRPASITINVAFFDGSIAPPTTYIWNTYVVQVVATQGPALFAYVENQSQSDAAFTAQGLTGWSLGITGSGTALVNVQITTGAAPIPGSTTWFCNYNYTITGGQ